MLRNVRRKTSYKLENGSVFEVCVIREGMHAGPEFIEINLNKLEPSFHEIRHFDLSPDGRRVAVYAKTADGTLHVFIDEKADAAIEDLRSGIFFSEDSLHYPYTARLKNGAGEQRYVVVVDGHVQHEEAFVFGFDAHLQSPGPLYKHVLKPQA